MYISITCPPLPNCHICTTIKSLASPQLSHLLNHLLPATTLLETMSSGEHSNRPKWIIRHLSHTLLMLWAPSSRRNIKCYWLYSSSKAGRWSWWVPCPCTWGIFQATFRFWVKLLNTIIAFLYLYCTIGAEYDMLKHCHYADWHSIPISGSPWYVSPQTAWGHTYSLDR